jgi:hypothetical protein
MCDDTYPNKSSPVVAQGMFNLREINQMEREICNYLECELTAANPMLSTFELAVKKDFGEEKQLYPTYPTSFVSKRIERKLPRRTVLSKNTRPHPVNRLSFLFD